MLTTAIIGGVASIAGGIIGASAADDRRRAARKDGDANEWIPTDAVKKIKEIQNTFDSKMTETCIS